MVSCKNCIQYDVCECADNLQYENVEILKHDCPCFKNKADFVEVVRGIDQGDLDECDEWYSPVHICSICGCNWMVYRTEESHYCPNCGAKMDGEKDLKERGSE